MFAEPEEPVPRQEPSSREHAHGEDEHTAAAVCAVRALEHEDASGRRVGGRARGSFNFRSEDLNALLDNIEDVLPASPDEWNTVEERFAAWSRNSNRPPRTHASLFKKFRRLVNAAPSAGQLSPQQARARDLEDQIIRKLEEQRPPLDQSRTSGHNHAGHSSDSSSGSESPQESQPRRRRNTRGRSARTRGPYARSYNRESQADSRHEEMLRQILELQKQSLEAESQSRAESFQQLAHFFGTLTNFLISHQAAAASARSPPPGAGQVGQVAGAHAGAAPPPPHVSEHASLHAAHAAAAGAAAGTAAAATHLSAADVSPQAFSAFPTAPPPDAHTQPPPERTT